MTLSACRCDYFRIVSTLLGKKYQRSVVGVIQVHRTVTGVTVESECRERPGCGIYRSRVTTRASIRETVLIPDRLLEIDPFLDLAAASEFRLSVEDRELSVPLLFEEAQAVTAAEEVLEQCVRYRDRVRSQMEKDA